MSIQDVESLVRIGVLVFGVICMFGCVFMVIYMLSNKGKWGHK